MDAVSYPTGQFQSSVWNVFLMLFIYLVVSLDIQLGLFLYSPLPSVFFPTLYCVN